MAIFLALLAIGLILYGAYRVKHRKLFRLSAELDGPPDYPLIGSGYLFFGKDNAEQFRVLLEVSGSYKMPCRAWLGPKLYVFIDNPDDIQIVLNSQNMLQKADMYNFFRCDLGLFSSTTEVWKVHRKLLNPCFNPSILASFVPIFNQKCSVLVDRIACHLNSDRMFNINEYISRCTLDMVCATTLGTKMDLQNEEGDEFIKALDNACELMNHRIFKIWLHPEWIYRMTKYYQLEKQYYASAYKMSTKVLAMKYEEIANGIKTYLPRDTDNPKKPQIYIDQIFRLAEESNVFHERAIKDEIDTIIVGGNETSALTLSHVVLMLAIHQDVQDRVYNEIVQVVGQDASIQVQVEHLTELPYTEMVLKETMRLFPVGPILGRKCMADTKLTNVTIPAGVTVAMGLFNIHRNPEFWGENCEAFNPDNFCPEKVAQRHPYSFLPFSGGPRNCIGYKYGLMSMKIMLSHLLRSYKFSSDLTMDQITLKMSITLKIANKHMVRIQPRH